MSHEPKLAALLACEEGLLSQEGTRRLQTHLSGCEVCREALASMRAYDELLDGVREQPAPQLDFSRMELALRRQARTQAQQVREQHVPVGRAMLAAVAVAAAVVLAVFVGRPAEPEVVSIRPTRAAPLFDEIATPLAALNVESRVGTVTARIGETTANGGTIDVGDQVVEGDALATAGGELHVRFEEGTGIRFSGDSAAHVSQLRAGDIRIALERGTVANQVATLSPGQSYVVDAGEYSVEVRGTLFSVSVDGDGAVGVVLDEGVVEVTQEARRIARLVAPARWSSSSSPASRTDVPAPHGLAAGAAQWPVLRIPMQGGVTRWEIGDGRFHAIGELAMRLPQGPVQLRGFDRDRLVFETVVTQAGDGVTLEADALRPNAPAVRQGTLAPELIAPTVQAGVRRMRNCQQTVARSTGETVVGRFSLRITIGLTGAVQSARLAPVAGGPPPATFQRCILQEAHSWGFPPPTGGIVTFDQPLRFGTRQ